MKPFLLALAAASLVAIPACQNPTDSTSISQGNPAPWQTTSIAAAQQIDISSADCVAPGTVIDPGPTVRVTDAGGRPQSGVTVSFAVSGLGGITRTVATTDAAGMASAGAWRLGDTPGMNSVTASLASGLNVGFSVQTADRDSVRAVFDLTEIAGVRVAFTAVPESGGHYYLGTRTYSLRYDFDGTTPVVPATICSTASYLVTPTGYQFYLAPDSYPASSFYQDRGGLFATGTLKNGNTMYVRYQDFVDFDDETYVLSAGTPPSSASLRHAP